MSARDSMLSRIRGALGRSEGQTIPKPPPVRIAPRDTTVAERVESFRTALERLSAETFVADSVQAAAAHIREVIGERPVFCTNNPVLQELGLFGDSNVEIAKAEVGVTGADYGLADTGTLVVLASGDPRLASLLPPVHIAVLKIERLLSGLDELLSVLPHPAETASSMVLITGPSRTGDIEQILVRGVHGPGHLHAVLVR